ncbi:MAG: protease modulator HflC [Alphaproteobacteria bacterium]
MKIFNNPLALAVSVFILFVAGWGTFFIVEQTQQVTVLQFGELQRVINTPGLKMKIPFLQEVVFYERRILDLGSAAPVRITMSDQKRLWVDSYTRYRIVDPLLFYRTVRPADETGARSRLDVLVSSSIRNVLGKSTLRGLLSEERSQIMRQIQEEVSTFAKTLGIEVIDVRIIRAELPAENRKAVFARMNSDLYRIAMENRAKGVESAKTIEANANKERTVILSDAEKQAESVRGEGDAKAGTIAARTLGQNLEYYTFDKKMRILKETMNADNTTLVLTTESELLQLIEQSNIHTKN